jgi:hypothetical protein
MTDESGFFSTFSAGETRRTALQEVSQGVGAADLIVVKPGWHEYRLRQCAVHVERYAPGKTPRPASSTATCV